MAIFFHDLRRTVRRACQHQFEPTAMRSMLLRRGEHVGPSMRRVLPQIVRRREEEENNEGQGQT